jgi:hypothetical protein
MTGNTSMAQMQKALNAPDAEFTFNTLGRILPPEDMALLLNQEICDKQSLTAATEEQLVETGLNAEQAKAVKAAFPSAQ